MNKLMARIVAVIMAVAMLGTVSFAAGYTAETGVIAPGITDDASDAMETVLVYATNTPNAAYASGDVIVAIKQAADVSGDIAVDTAKVAAAGKNYLTIAVGGTDGEVDYTSIDIRGDVTLTAVAVEDEYVAADGTIYTNVAYAKFALPTDGKIAAWGVSFKSHADGATAIEVGKTFDTAVQISGTIEFEALVLGVPYGEMEGTEVIATPYVVYAQ